MAVKAGRVVINLTAGTAEYFPEMNRAADAWDNVARKANGAGQRIDEVAAKGGRAGRALSDGMAHGVTGIQGVSGALRVAEGNLNNNIRAAERFLATTLGLGPLFQKIFPIVGGIALLGIFEHLIQKGKELYDAYKKLEEQPTKIAEGFRTITAPLQKSNDELSVANDKLQNEINKLEGKPRDGLKLALDEAIVSSDALAESLDHTLAEVEKLLGENRRGFLGWAFGKVDTGPIEESQKKLRKNLGDITDAADEQLANLGKKAEDAQKLPDKERIDALKSLRDQGDVIHTKERTDAERALRTELDAINADLKTRKTLSDAVPDVPSKRIQTPATVPVDPATIAGFRRDLGEAWVQKNINDGRMAVGSNAGDSIEVRKSTASVPGEESAVKDEEGRRKVINRLLSELSRRALNEQLTQKLEPLKAAHEGERRTDPFGDELAKLDAQLRGVNEELKAAGQSESGRLLAKSWAEAQNAIERVNKSLREEKKKPLTLDQEVQIVTQFDSINAVKQEIEFRDAFSKGNAAISERIQLQNLLTDAVGKGYAAIKAATVHGEVVQSFGGAEKFAEAQKLHPEQVAQRTALVNADYDAKRSDTIANTIDQLHDQSELEKSVASAERQGAEAVRLVTLAYKLREITMNGARDAQGNLTKATRDHIQAEVDLYNAQKQTQSAANVTKLDQESAAIQRLTAAQLQGAEAVRQAQLATKYEQMQRAGATPEEVRKTRSLDDLEHQRDITTEALKTGLTYQNQLTSIDEQIAKLHELQATQGDTLAIEISLKKLTQERTRILSEQVAVLGSARDGLRAFFQEMAADGKSAAAEVHDALSNAFTSLNDELAKIMSGQKASWQHFFQGISEQLAKQALQRLEASAAGGIFGDGQPKQPKVTGPFGIPLPTAPVATSGNTNHPEHHGLRGLLDKLAGSTKPRGRDGSSPSNGLFVIPVGATGVLASSTPGGQIIPFPSPSGNPNVLNVPVNNGPLGTPSGDVNGPASILLRPFGPAESDLTPLATIAPQPQTLMDVLNPLPQPPPYEGFAAGGDVAADKTILVGEKGPELFVPPSAGKIVPNHKLQSFEAFAAGSDLSSLMLPFATGNAYSDAPASPAKGSGGGLFADLDQDGQTDSTPLFVALTNQGVAEAVPVVPAQIANQASVVGGSSRTADTVNSYAGLAVNAIGPILGLADPSNPNVPPGAKLGSSPGNPLYVSEVATPGTAGQTSNRTFAPTSTNNQNVFGSIAGIAGPGLEQLSATPGLDGSATLGLQAAGMAGNVLGGLFGSSSDSGSGDNTSSDPFFGDPFSASGGNDIITGSSLQPGGASLDGPAGGVINSIVGLFNKGGDAPTGGKQGGSASNPPYVKDVSSGGSSGGGMGGLGGGLGSLLGMFGGSGAAAGSAGAADAFSLGDAADLGLIGGMAKGGDVRRNKPIIVGERGRELFVPQTHGTIIPNHRLSSLGRQFGGYRAEGGDVSPGQAYMVGEQGREVMMSAANSAAYNSTSRAQYANAAHNVAYYQIDARGTDANLVDKRVNASLAAVHGSAVQHSFTAQQEHMKRTPQT